MLRFVCFFVGNMCRASMVHVFCFLLLGQTLANGLVCSGNDACSGTENERKSETGTTLTCTNTGERKCQYLDFSCSSSSCTVLPCSAMILTALKAKANLSKYCVESVQDLFFFTNKARKGQRRVTREAKGVQVRVSQKRT